MSVETCEGRGAVFGLLCRWAAVFLGCEGERQPEEGPGLLALGAKITKQGNGFGEENRGRGGCLYGGAAEKIKWV